MYKWTVKLLFLTEGHFVNTKLTKFLETLRIYEIFDNLTFDNPNNSDEQ